MKNKKASIKTKLQLSDLDKIVHDVRNLVHNIYYISECLKEDWSKLSDNDRVFQLSKISSASNKLREFSDQFLDLSKLKAKKMMFNFQRIDLLQLIHEVIAEYQELELKNKPTKWILETSDCNEAATHSDPIKLKQLLRNLFSNANKYGGRGLITIQLKKANYEGGIFWHFSLSDKGKGIPEQELQLIFEPFVTSSNNKAGTGLGLAICKQIITAHQGIIWAENNSEQGTTFNFMLPILSNASAN